MAQGSVVEAPVPLSSKLDRLSDLELVAAINGGDTTAFEVLYFRYRDWVVTQAYRFTRDSHSALDVMQETFLYVLKKFPGFKLTANFKTFLYPAVHNLSIGIRRKAARYQTEGSEAFALENTPAPISQSSSASDLNAVLACLSEEQREVLLLRFVDGLTLAEVSEAMSIPIGTVKSRLHYALDLLRKDPRTAEFFLK